MSENEKYLTICTCGVPRPQGARVVIRDGFVYCNAACAAHNGSKAHQWERYGDPYIQRDVIVGGDH